MVERKRNEMMRGFWFCPPIAIMLVVRVLTRLLHSGLGVSYRTLDIDEKSKKTVSLFSCISTNFTNMLVNHAQVQIRFSASNIRNFMLPQYYDL